MAIEKNQNPGGRFGATFLIIHIFQVTLRQLDMKLLCQLWALNESLQDYKKTLEDDEHQREVTR